MGSSIKLGTGTVLAHQKQYAARWADSATMIRRILFLMYIYAVNAGINLTAGIETLILCLSRLD